MVVHVTPLVKFPRMLRMQESDCLGIKIGEFGSGCFSEPYLWGVLVYIGH